MIVKMVGILQKMKVYSRDSDLGITDGTQRAWYTVWLQSSFTWQVCLLFKQYGQLFLIFLLLFLWHSGYYRYYCCNNTLLLFITMHCFDAPQYHLYLPGTWRQWEPCKAGTI